MDPIFTEYVRSLTPGVEPDPQRFKEVWSTLRGALYHEMRQRSLLMLPPELFGIYGHPNWSNEDAFEELASDCYTFIFLERLPALKAQLKVKDNVEGLVFRNVRNFLHDAQKKNDPLGLKIYRILREALIQALGSGALRMLDGGPRLRGETILATAAYEASTTSTAADLDVIVRPWCDELTLDIVTARGQKREKVIDALEARIRELGPQGVESFRFKDLIDTIKAAVRVRWQALSAVGEGDTAFERIAGEPPQRVRTVRPDTGVEQRDSFAKLCAHVDERLAGARQPARSQRDLGRLWGYLKRQATGSSSSRIPSRRHVARTLELTRHQLAGHLAVLGRWVNQYQTAA